MRFSLKWLLAVMAYVALAAVAVREGKYYALALACGQPLQDARRRWRLNTGGTPLE